MEEGRTQACELENEEEGRLLEDFLLWAASIGITDSPPYSSPIGCLGDSIHLAQFLDAGGRGLAASRELKRQEIVLVVPRSALLTTENVLLRDPNLASFFQNHRRHLSPTQLLTVSLLFQVGKGKDSWWYPYLIQLPLSYDTLANFTQFEIQAFQVDYAIWIAEKAASKARVDWKQSLVLIQEIQLKPQLQTFKSWLWASSTVSSRALHVPWDPAGCLCPVGDLFNYAAPDEEDTEDTFSGRLTDGGYDEAKNSYCFYARKRYMKDEQVLLCYGTYTNLELLEHYGFLLASNPNEKSFIPLDPSMQQVSHCWPNESLYIHQDGTPSFALMASLRLLATPKSFRREIGHLVYAGVKVSSENETKVVKYLSEKCREVLDRVPTSHEDDRRILEVIGKILCNEETEEELEEIFRQSSEAQKVMVSGSLKARRRRMERWKLGVEWRVNYKRDLVECVVGFCNGVVN